MPNTKSAAKAMRVSARRQLRNKSTKSAVKTYLRKAEQAIADGGEQTEEAIRLAVRALDRAADKNILHPNNAARRKSRLMKKFTQAAHPDAAAVHAAPTRRRAASAPAKRGAAAKARAKRS